MKLTIVVICLNEEKNLPRCLGAMERLDHAGLEVDLLVVDGGSTDGSQQIARSLGARVVNSPKGIPIQRNVGGREASGDVLAYVDADVELVEGWFEAVTRLFGESTRLVAGSPPRLPQDASWVARAYAMHWGLDPEEMEGIQTIEDDRLLSTQSLVMGQEVYQSVGGFPEDLGVDEDTYVILRAKEQGYRVVCDTGLGYVHHGEPGTLGEFFHRIAWGANYSAWFEHLRAGDLAQARRPQYIYGAVFAAEVAALGLSLAAPLGGWQVGVPLSLAALGATVVLPAARTAVRHRAPGKLKDLCLMYGAYGAATATALVGVGRNKAKRWR